MCPVETCLLVGQMTNEMAMYGGRGWSYKISHDSIWLLAFSSLLFYDSMTAWLHIVYVYGQLDLFTYCFVVSTFIFDEQIKPSRGSRHYMSRGSCFFQFWGHEAGPKLNSIQIWLKSFSWSRILFYFFF